MMLSITAIQFGVVVNSNLVLFVAVALFVAFAVGGVVVAVVAVVVVVVVVVSCCSSCC